MRMTRGSRLGVVFTVAILAAVVTADVQAQTTATPGVIYASTGNNDGGRLLTIDPSTGAATLIADIPGLAAVSGLAVDSFGNLYGTDALDPSSLYRIDAATGAATLIGDTGVRGIDGIAFDERNVLYAAETFGQDQLYRIDPGSGAATLVGTMGASTEITGLAFDPTTGTLYGSTGGGVDEIYTINTSTGAATLIGTTGFGGSVPDLVFDTDGNLYGSNNQAGTFYFLSINKSTGAATQIGPTGINYVSGLAMHIPPVPIPVDDPWLLALLGATLAVAGAVVVRRT